MNEGGEYYLRFADARQFGPATMETIRHWAREGRVPRNAVLVPAAGGEPIAVEQVVSLSGILRAPPRPDQHPPDATGSSETWATVVPYRNPPALIGYYTSIISLIPIIGLIAGPAAIILGAVGFRARRKNPAVHGLAHAWVAILVGLLGSLISYGGLALLVWVA